MGHFRKNLDFVCGGGDILLTKAHLKWRFTSVIFYIYYIFIFLYSFTYRCFCSDLLAGVNAQKAKITLLAGAASRDSKRHVQTAR